jgi:hypothetical protein
MGGDSEDFRIFVCNVPANNSTISSRPRNRENRQSYKTPISPHLGFTAPPRDHGYVPVEGRTPNTILWRSTRPNVFGGLKPDCPEQSHTATTLPPHCHHTANALRPLLAHGMMRYRAQVSRDAPNKQGGQTLCFAPCALLDLELWWQALAGGDRCALSLRTGLGRKRAAVADE